MTIKLSTFGIDWDAPTTQVIDELINRYMDAVPGATFTAALRTAERIYSSHGDLPWATGHYEEAP